jgi:hypothetical protein
VEDAEHIHHFIFDGEQDTVDMRLVPIKQLAENCPRTRKSAPAFCNLSDCIIWE